MSRFIESDPELSEFKFTIPGSSNGAENNDYKQKVKQILESGEPDEQSKAILRGWIKDPDPDQEGLQLVFRCMEVLSKTDDPRDLLILFWRGAGKLDRNLVRSVFQKSELSQPLSSMVGNLLGVGKGDTR